MPKGKKHSPEQIIAVLRRAEGGKSVSEFCREVNISEASFYRWQRQYGGMEKRVRRVSPNIGKPPRLA